MDKSYAEVSKQLGMSRSTATSLLLRRILFDLVQRLGLDVCFRCGERILTIVDFSIDHKKPWLHVSPELFWDLSNIAFSHDRCNSRAHRNFRNYKVGVLWCPDCGGYKPVSAFPKNRARKTGRGSWCKYHRNLRKRGAHVTTA